MNNLAKSQIFKNSMKKQVTSAAEQDEQLESRVLKMKESFYHLHHNHPNKNKV